MRTALILAFCALAAGCVTSQLHRLDPDVRPARAPVMVAVLDAVPDRPYQLIARIESRSANVFISFADLRERIVAQATQVGADAVVVGPGSTKTEFIILPTGIIPSERRTLTADVIVFRWASDGPAVAFRPILSKPESLDPAEGHRFATTPSEPNGRSGLRGSSRSSSSARSRSRQAPAGVATSGRTGSVPLDSGFVGRPNATARAGS